MDIASLENLPRFTALSYTWQDPPIFNNQTTSIMDFVVPNEYQYSFQATQRILINGRVLKVGKNLHAALKYLRSAGSRTIWVDAICINQEDKVEQMQQIQKMDKVYGQASTVLVWLGPAYLNSDLAIETVRHLSELVHRTGYRQIFRRSVEFEDPITVQ